MRVIYACFRTITRYSGEKRPIETTERQWQSCAGCQYRDDLSACAGWLKSMDATAVSKREYEEIIIASFSARPQPPAAEPEQSLITDPAIYGPHDEDGSAGFGAPTREGAVA